jgi:hypothetical protein
VIEDDELDFAELINRESREIQTVIGSEADVVRAEIRNASVWQQPNDELDALVRHLVNGEPGSDLTVTLLTAGALVAGRLTTQIRWHQAVRGPLAEAAAPDPDGEPWVAHEIYRLIANSAPYDYVRAASLGPHAQYYLLDATIQPLGADRSASTPARPWIVQARHVIGWTPGDWATAAH